MLELHQYLITKYWEGKSNFFTASQLFRSKYSGISPNSQNFLKNQICLKNLKFTWKSKNSQNATAEGEELRILAVGLCTHYKTMCIPTIPTARLYNTQYIPTSRQYNTQYNTHFQQKAKHERGQWGQFGDRINKVTDPREWVDLANIKHITT